MVLTPYPQYFGIPHSIFRCPYSLLFLLEGSQGKLQTFSCQSGSGIGILGPGLGLLPGNMTPFYLAHRITLRILV